MQTTSIIRDRGQLTIPDSIRNMLDWVSPLSAVSISVRTFDEIVIRPHVQRIHTDQIWEHIRKSRAITGKGKTNASACIQADRNSH